MLRRIVRVAAVLPAAFTFAQDHDLKDPQQQRLGVVVPAYDGDLARAVSSLERWPAKCSPLTLENADLVLYYAEEESSATASALESISSTAGRCFSRTRIVYANLAEEDDIYPQGPSVMFYNMFLDESVRSSLSGYDALSIIEWDVLVASDNSFEELYHAAFRVNEEFWVKGSNLEGTSFHSNADAIEMWHVLGHINGNAIYNNDDPAFVEYVEYTRARWGYEHPYDVALWMTISDFPYSWPLYQRYSSKFVVTNLISSVGYEHVNHDTVSDAVAGKTLFIHGSSVDEGNVASYEATEGDAAVDVATSQRQLTEDVPKWQAQEKWRNTSVPKWKRNQKWKKQYEDSSDEEGCMDGCEYTSKDGTRGRVCDSNCSSPNVYGTLGCGAKNGKYGADCRACYNDDEKARKQDTPGNRAIMCSTKMPVDVYGRRLTTADEVNPLLVARDLEALQKDEEHRQLSEDVPKWRAQEKWKNNTVPKWKRNQKWKKQYEDSSDEEGCMDGCEYTSKDGTRGRVCDSNCSSSNVYGTLGCGAKNGKYGADCRACYNDDEKARKQDTPGNRAIMCSTREPVDVYGRRLSGHQDFSLELARLTEAENSEDEDSEDGFEPRVDVEVGGREKAVRFFEAAAERTYLGEVERGNLCAFVSGWAGEEAMWEVTVKSILQFMPGMKVAVAAEAEGLDAYERSMGRLPGVTVSGTQNPATATLYADKYCSFSELILYVKPGSVLSRSFTSKDTHSPRGDLLVVHAGSQGSYHDTELSRRSASVLGFEAPSFTQGTDLMLPGDANYYLREALGLKIGSDGLQGDGDGDAVIALQKFVDFDQVSAVPQVLAAVAYSRETPGVWFIDPRGWVGQNLFKEASIWDIPLVKPRFTCTIAADKLDSASPKTAETLQSSVDFFANGGKCANGLIAAAP